MTLIELQEKRNRLFTETQTLANGESVTAETREKIKLMLADLDVIEGDIETRKRLDKIDAEMRATVKPTRGNPGAEAADSNKNNDAVKRAYTKYIKSGDKYLSSEERAILTTGAGGYIVPQLFDPTIYQAQKLIGNTWNIVGKKVTNNNGAPMKISTINDTANTLVTITGGEGTAVGEVDPTFNGVISSCDTIATQITLSFQELEDSFFDLDTFIKNWLAVRYTRGLEKLMALGNSSNVASFVPATSTVTATGTYASGNHINLLSGQVGPQYADFVGMLAALDPSYEPNASWVMNSATRSYLIGQTDDYGRPFWTPNPTTGVLDQILGSPVVLNQALPNAVNSSTTATATGIVYGDFEQGYLLRTDGPLSIRRSDDVLLQSLETVFVAYSRVGGVFINSGATPLISLETPEA